MDFTIGSLELNRSNPAHLGTAPLIDSFGGEKKASVEKSKGSFENYLLAV